MSRDYLDVLCTKKMSRSHLDGALSEVLDQEFFTSRILVNHMPHSKKLSRTYLDGALSEVLHQLAAAAANGRDILQVDVRLLLHAWIQNLELSLRLIMAFATRHVNQFCTSSAVPSTTWMREKR